VWKESLFFCENLTEHKHIARGKNIEHFGVKNMVQIFTILQAKSVTLVCLGQDNIHMSYTLEEFQLKVIKEPLSLARKHRVSYSATITLC
jgi:hypothetical protein